MYKFDLERAMKGDKIVRRSGREVIFVDYCEGAPWPLKAKVDPLLDVLHFRKDGTFDSSSRASHDFDLFMAEPKEIKFIDVLEQTKKNSEVLSVKPFNYEEYKAGKPVCYRNGKKFEGEIFLSERTFKINLIQNKGRYPLLILDEGGKPITYTLEGLILDSDSKNDHDLFMAPEKRTIWTVAFYQYPIDKSLCDKPMSRVEGMYSTKKEAEDAAEEACKYFPSLGAVFVEIEV